MKQRWFACLAQHGRRWVRTLGLTIATALLAGGAAALEVLPSRNPSAAVAGASADLAGARARTEHAQVALLAHAPQGVAPGRALWLGLQLQHEPGWHTYWHNPGDSGLPIELQWTLPEGVQAGPIQWPTPRKFPIGELANYGFDGTVLLPVPLTLPPTWRAEALPVRLHATWLICRQECVPEEATLQLTLPVGAVVGEHAAAFEAAWAAAPRALPGARAALRVDDAGLHLEVAGLPGDWQGRTLEFFPETGNLIAPGAPWTQRWDGPVWRASVPLHPYRTETATRLAFVLALADAGHGPAPAGVRLDSAVQGTWPAPPAPAPLTATAPVPPTPADATGEVTALGLALAVLGALVGGMILNLMPCVFPVLAIKVMAFQAHGADARAHRLGGLAYTAGVVLSFAALGAALLALRSAGEAVGWGFQLQNPWVVAGLATLFLVIALNLAGVYEVGALAPSGLAGMQLRHPLGDAFLTGVLASVVASPCTAPFMGASLGLAVTLPGPAALAVFASLGLGMALPYLAASWWPALARRLPRPGPWMQTLRQALAFPMLAAAVWLLWVLGQQTSVHGLAALLLLWLALAWVLWAWARRARVLTALGALALAALAVGVGPHVVREATMLAGAATAQEAERWQAWTPQRQADLLAAGRPVFVDFTAAWCVTCQVNKAAVLSDAEVLRAADAANIALLRADWTRRDPTITAALAALGRSGVPVYVLHVPGRAPQVLTEVLSVAEVRAAFEGARR
ncbi:MAG: protein-disulfide reductase DsbD family protein [Tepidimonas ignava]|uniref:protein-disulfide reductase DsbD family protein n=1 Tax=Tepidimonas ignava TaxID=114249 RepID=UPI003919345E